MRKMTVSDERISPKGMVRRILRTTSSVAGLCGFILNTVTLAIAASGGFPWYKRHLTGLVGGAYAPIVLSVAWNHLEHLTLQRLPNEYKWATVVVDAGFMIGYVVLLLESGIYATRAWPVQNSKIMLLTLNMVPWMVCA